jgi:methylated-DNA-[protein]-cysteine S-methyltransferase
MSQLDRPPPARLIYDTLETPIGVAVIMSDEHGVLRGFNWTEWLDRLLTWTAKHYPGVPVEKGALPGALRQSFVDYFAGDARAIDTVPWEASGTEFQRTVWKALCEIPSGETWTYSQLAHHVGRPTARRAVGLANGQNPVAVVVPCHRVIGADGSLTGYGGGIERKRWLLAHEGATAKDDLFAA